MNNRYTFAINDEICINAKVKPESGNLRGNTNVKFVENLIRREILK
jgi:hypothetical protein